ncbi:uncharacterized protein LOC110822976 [Carica papaya]|uniref:uncharacterized protein LOC110822976 n=1 Tax=Carica papaya TaxID=3649 RepID=UPI000B8CFF77|nr:uncharacterized protein LOC110822976 [Carica papaya]
MPMSIYSKLSVRQLKETGVIIQLADRSVVDPKGVLNDVLVQVDNLILTSNFYVRDMEDDKSSKSFHLLLGRPFLNIAKTKIDVQDDTLTMEFDGKVVKFNVYDAIKYSYNLSCAYNIDIIDALNQKYFDLGHDDEVNIALCNVLNADNFGILEEDHVADQNLQEAMFELESF